MESKKMEWKKVLLGPPYLEHTNDCVFLEKWPLGVPIRKRMDDSTASSRFVASFSVGVSAGSHHHITLTATVDPLSPTDMRSSASTSIVVSASLPPSPTILFHFL
jgi:hypothetical protein